MTELHRFRQRNSRFFLEVAFHDDYLEYLLPLQAFGTANRCKADYEKLPSAFEYCDVTYRYAPGVAFVLSIACGFYYFFIYPWIILHHISLHWALRVGMPLLALLSIAYYINQRWAIFPRLFIQHFTLVPMEQNRHLLVHKDKQHDKILNLLAEMRKASLHKYAEVDPLLSPLWQVKRLRWLHEQNVISLAELVGSEEKIRTHFPKLTFQPYTERANLPKDSTPEVIFKQKGSQGVYQFLFCKDHLRYCTEERGFNIHYSDIASLNESEETFKGEDYSLSFLCCMLCVCGCMSLIAFYFEARKYYPLYFDFYHDTLFVIYAALALALSAVATVHSFRLADNRFVRVHTSKGAIDILHDKNKAAILDEIAKRRLAALRQLAVIDDLSSREDEARKFYALKQDGIISDNEYKAFSERIINTHFFGSEESETKNIVLN